MEEKQETVHERPSPPPLSEERPPLPEVGEGSLSIQAIVNRLDDLVRFALECEHKPLQPDVSFVEVYKQLLEVRKSIDALSQDQQNMLTAIEAVGLKPVQLGEAYSPEDKKVILKLQNLQGICEAAKERLHKSIEKNPEAEKEVKEKIQTVTSSEKQKVVHRKGKFRPLGGKGGWIPT